MGLVAWGGPSALIPPLWFGCPSPQVPTCTAACLGALAEVELDTVGAVHEALLLLGSPTLPAHTRGRLLSFEQRCQAALMQLAHACPGSDGLLAPLLLVLGDLPATLGQEGLRRAVKGLPPSAVLRLASSDELRVTCENDVLVRQRAVGWAGGSGLGWWCGM